MFGTKLDLVVLAPENALGAESFAAFRPLGVHVHRIPASPAPIPKHWSAQFYKLYAFRLTMYERVLLVDADTLATTNVDDVFEQCGDADVCASKNPGRLPTSRMQATIGVEKYANGGMFVLTPNVGMFDDMYRLVEESGTCCKWAFEQDFFNWYFWGKRGMFAGRTVRLLPWGHYNTYPATHLVHFIRGKPWHWWAYPVPFPFAPTGHVWGAVSSLQWAYVRGTLPAGALGGFGNLGFLAHALFPVLVVWGSTTGTRPGKRGHRRVPVGAASAGLLALWALIFACGGRGCDMEWVPGSMPPQLAWALVASLSASVVVVVVAAGRNGRSAWWMFGELVVVFLGSVGGVAVLRFLSYAPASSGGKAWTVAALAHLYVVERIVQRHGGGCRGEGRGRGAGLLPKHA
jgi:hypothetical protein